MNVMTMPVDVLHADLWGGLLIEERRINGPEDVTLGWHPVLGRCVVSYSPCASRVEWITHHPLPKLDKSDTLNAAVAAAHEGNF